MAYADVVKIGSDENKIKEIIERYNAQVSEEESEGDDWDEEV